jgi:hypothetical protein
VESGKLKAFTVPAEADVFVLAVPTPFHDDGGETPRPNIDYVLAATRAVAHEGVLHLLDVRQSVEVALAVKPYDVSARLARLDGSRVAGGEGGQ